MIEHCYSCKFFKRGISTSPTGVCSKYGEKSPVEEACKDFKMYIRTIKLCTFQTINTKQ